MLELSDGSILVGTDDGEVVKYLGDGTLDLTFGIAGMVQLETYESWSGNWNLTASPVRQMWLDDTGRIYVDLRDDILRLNADGTKSLYYPLDGFYSSWENMTWPLSGGSSLTQYRQQIPTHDTTGQRLPDFENNLLVALGVSWGESNILHMQALASGKYAVLTDDGVMHVVNADGTTDETWGLDSGPGSSLSFTSSSGDVPAPYDGMSIESIAGIVQTADGGLVVAGQGKWCPDVESYYCGFIVKYTAAGELLPRTALTVGETVFAPDTTDVYGFNSITEDCVGNLIVSGSKTQGSPQSMWFFAADGSTVDGVVSNIDPALLGTEGNTDYVVNGVRTLADCTIAVVGTFVEPTGRLYRMYGGQPTGGVQVPAVSLSPTKLSAGIKVTIKPNSSGGRPTGYLIEYRQADGTWIALTEAPAAGTFVTISDLTEGVLYEVRVKACIGESCSDWSTIQSGLPGEAAKWKSLGGGLVSAASPAAMTEKVYAIDARQAGRSLDYGVGVVVAGGDFDSIGGVSAKNIAMWDGSRWHAMGAGLNDNVYAVLVDPWSGEIFAGGSFTASGSGAEAVAVAGVAKWNPNTESWEPLEQGVDGIVFAIERSYDDYQIYIGGNFQHAIDSSGTQLDTPALVTWDGEVLGDPQAGLSSGDTVRSLYSAGAYADSCNGSMLVAGNFTVDGAQNFGRFAYGYWDRVQVSSSPSAGVSAAVERYNNAAQGCDIAVALNGGSSSSIEGTSIQAAGMFSNYFNYQGSLNWIDLSGAGTFFDTEEGTSAVAMDGHYTYFGGYLTSTSDPNLNSVFRVPTLSKASQLASYNANESLAQPMGGGVNGAVYALSIDPQGNVWAGGRFNHAMLADGSSISGTAGIARFGEPVPAPPSSPSLAFSATTFEEAVANDGSTTDVLTATLTDDTFTGTNGDTFADVVTNVPAGLTAVVTRTSDTTVTLALTGNATSHANADDVSNLTFTLTDAMVTSGVAADITGYSKNDLAIDFADPAGPSPVTLSSATPSDDATGIVPTSNIVLTFSENIGWDTGSVYLKKSSDDTTVATFNSASAAGLATISTTQLTLNPSIDLDWATGYYLTIDASAIKSTTTAGTFAGISSKTDLNFTTKAQPTLTWSGSSFTEASANDGSTTDVLTATLTGDTFTGSNTDTFTGVVTNVPTGMTAVVTRTSSTTVTVALTGNASSHANANDVSNLTFTLTNAMVTSAAASSVSGYSKTDLAIDFADPVAAAVTLSSSTPADGATGVLRNATVSLTFSQSVAWGVGSVKLYKSDDTLIETFTSASSGAAISGSTLTLTPAALLDWATSYYIKVDASAITSSTTAGTFAGITSKTDLNFTTKAQPAITWSASRFVEGSANDGSIATTITATLSDDTFTGTDGDTFTSIMTNVPAGLTAVVTRTSSTTVTFAFTGSATSHTNADDVANLTATLPDSLFTGGSAAVVLNATKSNLTIDFADPGMLPGTAVKVEVQVAIGAELSGADAELTGSGLKPNSDYRLELHSTTVVLATGTADADGAIHQTVVLPDGVCIEPGLHELVLTALSPDDVVVTASQYITLGGNCTVWSKADTSVTLVAIDAILFPMGKSTLSPLERRKLRAMIPLLRGARKIAVYGYTQTNLRDKSASVRAVNVRLGRARARAVADYLRYRGITLTIKTIGKGPVDGRYSKKRQQYLNRRAVIIAVFPEPES